MDAKRTSEVIDKEIQELRGKLRALESEKQEHTKALEKAQRERKKAPTRLTGRRTRRPKSD